MSDEQIAQAEKNTRDIRSFKVAVPLTWLAASLITGASILWGIATYSANKVNADKNYKADQIRQSQDMKKYFDNRLQQLRTKDSTDISTVNANVLNMINSNQIKTDDEIGLLREQCKRGMNLSYGEQYHYDNTGKRIVTAVRNK